MSPFDERLEPVRLAPFVRLADERGSLTRVFARGTFTAEGFGIEQRQLLYSHTDRAGVLRGLHAQLPPFSESKIVVALSGRIFWVVVDLRRGSCSFGHWQGFELAPQGADASGLQVPAGFAHGCLSLLSDTGVMILADQEFAPGHGVGIAWDDPELGIRWPLEASAPVLSKEHAAYGSFAQFRTRVGGL